MVNWGVRIVTIGILLWGAHVTFGVNRIVVIPGSHSRSRRSRQTPCGCPCRGTRQAWHAAGTGHRLHRRPFRGAAGRACGAGSSDCRRAHLAADRHAGGQPQYSPLDARRDTRTRSHHRWRRRIRPGTQSHQGWRGRAAAPPGGPQAVARAPRRGPEHKRQQEHFGDDAAYDDALVAGEHDIAKDRGLRFLLTAIEIDPEQIANGERRGPAATRGLVLYPVRRSGRRSAGCP